MNTLLSSQQEAEKKLYRQFAKEFVAPQAKDLESHTTSLRGFLESLGQLGYLGMSVPAEFGGQGKSFLNVALFVEALSEFEPGLGFTLAGHVAAVELVRKYGSQNQKSCYLPKLARGEAIASIAFSEQAAGTDLSAVETKVLTQDGQLYLSGAKSLVVNAEVANLFVVLACTDSCDQAQGQTPALMPGCIEECGGGGNPRQTDLKDLGVAGEVSLEPDKELGLYLVDACPSLKIMPECGRLGLKSAYVNDLELAQLALTPQSLLVATNLVWQAVAYAMDVAKVVIAASAVGLSEGALSSAAQHARTRIQFGSPIGQFQAIQWKLADHLVGLSGARLQTYRAAWSKDNEEESFGRYAAMCKWYATKVARYYSGEALQVLGSFGLSTESSLERFYRDAKVTEICYGTSEFQKVLLAKELDI